MGARSLLLIIGSACFYKLLSIDPGIKSNGAPIINLPEVSQYHKYYTFYLVFALNANATKAQRLSIALSVESA